MSLSLVKELIAAYKEWVISNPSLISDVETISKWASYFIAGKLNKSPVVSELIYSLSNLFVLYNDALILKSQPNYNQSKRKGSLKYWMTVLHFSEVFIEMLARSKWGTRGKWGAATTVQLVKCIANLVLIYHYKETPVQHPPVSTLHRKHINEKNTTESSGEGFTLRRSGRVMRRVQDAPITQLRNWRPPSAGEPCQGSSTVRRNQDWQRLAETLYVTKPLLHLGAVAYFGSETWKQWLFALGIDLTSFSMYSDELKSLTYDQRVEISRRKLFLLYYLIRSPMYNKHSRAIINRLLTGAAKNIPLAGIICNPILQYISIWQDTYFYMWSN